MGDGDNPKRVSNSGEEAETAGPEASLKARKRLRKQD